MVQNTIQPWISEQDITTFHWMNLQYLKQPSLDHSEILNTAKYPSDLNKHPLFSGTHDKYLKGVFLSLLLTWMTAGQLRTHIPYQTSFWKITECSLINETQQMPFIHQRDSVPWTHPQHHKHQPTTMENSSHQQHEPPRQVSRYAHFWDLSDITESLSWIWQKTAKGLTLFTHHKAKFELSPTDHTAFMTLKEAIIQAPLLCHPDPARRYIVYMDASDDMCGAHLSQEYNGTKFPIAFLSHMFTETQRKWCTPEQEAYRVY